MTISPMLFLIIYMVAVAVFGCVGLLNIYHVIRFSQLRTTSIVVSFIFLILTVGIILQTLSLVAHVDWHDPIEIALPLTNASDAEPQ
ncbi:MAG: hypothetical protein ACOYUK_00045 [Patescibacteria group bacterium]